MCGIAGIITTHRDKARFALSQMIDAQRHRGPDDGGAECWDVGGVTVGIGNRRLAIQDVSPAGHQPMTHPATGDELVFNGEIYNVHPLRDELQALGERFRGHSDTEVLLHGLARFGVEYLKRLAGMYAIAFFDRSERTLLIARDPIGIKPLYIARVPGAILLASEVRALLASEMVPRRLDRTAAATLAAYGAVQEPLTIFADIRAFPAGCYQAFDLHEGTFESAAPRRGDSRHEAPPSGGEAVRFWSLPRADCPVSEVEAVSGLRRIADDAVRDHLISDVPVGVFLSSGLDSTAVAALAARHARELRTFTVGFTDQADGSETALARETARRIGARHTDVTINAPDALAAAEKWVAALDQPSVDGLNTFVISQAIRAHGIVVALSGLGGDELFGGYSSFWIVPQLRRASQRTRWVPAPVRRAAGRVLTLRRPIAVREKLDDMTTGDGSLLSLFLRHRRVLSNAQLAALGVDPRDAGLDAHYLPPGAMQDVTIDESDPLATISRLESRLYMGNTLLRDSDANGMAHSLEIRVPLLDQRLLDFAYSLPGPLRMPPGRPPKHLIRLAFADVLRPELLEQKKRGFTLPVGMWMLGPLRPLCESGLEHLKSLDVFARRGIDGVWQAFLRNADGRHWTTPLSLCILGLYAKRMNVF